MVGTISLIEVVCKVALFKLRYLILISIGHVMRAFAIQLTVTEGGLQSHFYLILVAVSVGKHSLARLLARSPLTLISLSTS